MHTILLVSAVRSWAGGAVDVYHASQRLLLPWLAFKPAAPVPFVTARPKKKQGPALGASK